jgi:hypothetical protein
MRRTISGIALCTMLLALCQSASAQQPQERIPRIFLSAIPAYNPGVSPVMLINPRALA